MRRVLSTLLAIVLVVLSAGISPSASQPAPAVLDLANVPLPLQDLPEDGYQILTGGYLRPGETAELVADARNLDNQTVVAENDEHGVARAYVLDVVLPLDRADANADLLAVLQTTVYHLDSEERAESYAEWLASSHESRFVTEVDPAVPGGHSVSLQGEGGEMLRTTIASGDVVIEIVSQETTGAPDATGHELVVEGTLERLDAVREGSDGLSPVAIRFTDSGSMLPFSHADQSGVHSVYRFRDGVLQEAAGEMIPQEGVTVEPGLEQIYYSNATVNTRNSIGFASVMLASFASPEEATAFYDNILANDRIEPFVDPYFAIAEGEQWTAQGDGGVYRITGSYRGDAYSGFVEVRIEGTVLMLVGYRVVGSGVPSPAIVAQLADAQHACVAGEDCAPIDLAAVAVPDEATPMADGSLGSPEFGWKIQPLGDEWKVTEQFQESGYDRIGIQNGNSLFELESVINHHGEPLQCVLDEMDLLREFEEHADIRVYEDAQLPSGGNTDDHAWVIYRVEPLADERADQEYVIRIDCYQLQPGASNLVVTHTASVADWPTERAKGDELRDAIILPESRAGHGKLAAPTHDRRTTMIDTIWIEIAD